MDATSETLIERDPQAAARESRAEGYFERDLAGQRGWYGARFALQSPRPDPRDSSRGGWRRHVFSAGLWWRALGIGDDSAAWRLVALAEGWRQIARYDETWAAYRLASERMKRERRLYVNGAGETRGLADETEAFLRFVEAIEAIVAEEQCIYWRNRGDGSPPASRASMPAAQGRTSTEDKQGHGRA